VVKARKGGTWRLFFILIKPIQVFLGESHPPIIMAGDPEGYLALQDI
jgi:hypothetical protein